MNNVPRHFRNLAGIAGLSTEEIQKTWIGIRQKTILGFLNTFWTEGDLSEDQKMKLGKLFQEILDTSSYEKDILSSIFPLLSESQQKNSVQLFSKLFAENIRAALQDLRNVLSPQQKAVERAYMKVKAP